MNLPDHDNSFHYHLVIGMLNYLDAGLQSNIVYATHQCTRFTTNLKQEDAQAIHWLSHYLKATHDKGLTFMPDPTAGLEVYIDMDFAGNWNHEEAENDQDMA